MRIALIGGSGFIGSALANRLIQGGAQCIVIDPWRPPSGFLGEYLSPPQRSSAWEGALEGIDVCIYLQCSTLPKSSFDQPILEIQENEMPLMQVLPHLQKKGIKLIYFSSGGAVYGEIEKGQASENHPLRPISPYGVGKKNAEAWIEWYQLQGLKALILRPSTIYGFGQGQQTGQGVVFSMLKATYTRNLFFLQGGGNQIKDFLFLEDLLDFVEYALIKNMLGVYNVCSGEAVSVFQVLEQVELIAGVPLKRELIPAHPSDVRRMSLDPGKAASEGWRAKTTLKQGVQNLWLTIQEQD